MTLSTTKDFKSNHNDEDSKVRTLGLREKAIEHVLKKFNNCNDYWRCSSSTNHHTDKSLLPLQVTLHFKKLHVSARKLPFATWTRQCLDYLMKYINDNWPRSVAQK